MSEIYAFWGPPGAGKTDSLLEIFQQEIENTDNIIEDIAVSTFRTALADEFKEKLKDRMNLEGLSSDNFIGTTHAICNRVLKYYEREFDVAGPEDKKEFCKQFGIPYSKKQENGFSPTYNSKKQGNLLFGLVSFCRNSLYDFSRYREGPISGKKQRELREDFLRDFQNEWEEYKEKNHLIDYADMLTMVYEEKLTPPVNVLLEDEFHDKTPLQYEVFKIWRENIPKVYIAGDKLQAIYSFWNTDPVFFEKEYDNADEREVLDESYRFGEKLWRYACKIVSNVGLETPEIDTREDRDTPVDFLTMNGFRKKAKKVSSDNSVFFLVRANYMKTPVSKILREVGVSFSIGHGKIDKIVHVYNAVAKIRKAILSSGFGYASRPIELRSEEAETLLRSYPSRHFDVKKKEIYSKCEEKDTVDVVVKPSFEGVFSGSGWPFSTEKLLKSPPFSEKARKQANIMWDRRDKEPIDLENRNVISTIHASKGKSADHVFLFDDITKTISKEMDVKNEARVFFVGATRARKHLWVVHGPNNYFDYNLPEVD